MKRENFVMNGRTLENLGQTINLTKGEAQTQNYWIGSFHGGQRRQVSPAAILIAPLNEANFGKG
jgi:hypothetical protein